MKTKIFDVLMTTTVLTIGICLLIYLFVEGVWYQWKDIFQMAWLPRTVWFAIATLTFLNVGFIAWMRPEKKEDEGDKEEETEGDTPDVPNCISKLLDFLGHTTNWTDLKVLFREAFEEYHYCNTTEFDKDQQVMYSEEREMRDRLNGILGTILSEDFAEMGEEDRHLLERQAVTMILYHTELFKRCLRYGVIRKNEDGE